MKKTKRSQSGAGVNTPAKKETAQKKQSSAAEKTDSAHNGRRDTLQNEKSTAEKKTSDKAGAEKDAGAEPILEAAQKAATAAERAANRNRNTQRAKQAAAAADEQKKKSGGKSVRIMPEDAGAVEGQGTGDSKKSGTAQEKSLEKAEEDATRLVDAQAADTVPVVFVEDGSALVAESEKATKKAARSDRKNPPTTQKESAQEETGAGAEPQELDDAGTSAAKQTQTEDESTDESVKADGTDAIDESDLTKEPGEEKAEAESADNAPTQETEEPDETPTKVDAGSDENKAGSELDDAEVDKIVAEELAAEENNKIEEQEKAETPDDIEPEKIEANGDADTAPEVDEPEPEHSAEERARLAEITRTVQLSVAQLEEAEAARSAAAEPNAETNFGGAEQPNPALAETEPEEESAQPGFLARMAEALKNGLLGIAKWLLLVAGLVALIAAVEIGWLYHSATRDMIPTVAVNFAGQTVETAAYDWKVPVASDWVKRTYRETVHAEGVTLATVETARPALTISPTGFASELTMEDSSGQTVFAGSADDFSKFEFEKNGNYTAELVLSKTQSAGQPETVGEQTYRFDFEVTVKPKVRLNTQAIAQGSIVALRVTDTLSADHPTVSTKLKNGGFIPASSGWVCYLPIALDQEPGEYPISVTANGYTQTTTLTVQERSWAYKDYGGSGSLVTPYLSQEDTPAEVRAVLGTIGDKVAWMESGFVQPFLSNIKIKLAYGTTEYVGRSASQRVDGTGEGRSATNTVITCTAGEQLICPADGTVLLAENLDGIAGNTVVIEHGDGLKSIFYGMKSLEVKKKQTVRQGQSLGTTSATMIVEVRVGTIPVDPLAVWRSQCDAVKTF